MTSGEVSSPSRWRAHYAQPFPVEFDVSLPGDLEDAEDERLFVLDAAPFTEQRSAVRVERVVPADTSGPGAPDGPIPNRSASASGNHGAGDLRASLVDLIRGDYPDVWTVPLPRHAEQIADAVLLAGFRRVAEDDDTAWQVAFALAGTDGWDIARPEPGCEPTPTAMRFLIMARAAVRALREAGE